MKRKISKKAKPVVAWAQVTPRGRFLRDDIGVMIWNSKRHCLTEIYGNERAAKVRIEEIK